MVTTFSLRHAIDWLIVGIAYQAVMGILIMTELVTYIMDDDPEEEQDPQDWVSRVLYATNRGIERIAGRLHARIKSNRNGRMRSIQYQINTKRRHKVSLRVFAAVIAMSAGMSNGARQVGTFDTDSRLVGIDNRCSGCISHRREDFPGELTECKRAIKGFGGARTYNVWQGTLQWDWDDDQGVPHRMTIPRSYYVPEGYVRLLSPQHWAQMRKNQDKRGGAGTTTTAQHVTLFWNKRENRKTVPIDSEHTNVATFALSGGYESYHRYCRETNTGTKDDDRDPITIDELRVDATVVSDDEDASDDDNGESSQEPQDPSDWPMEDEQNDNKPREFDINGKQATTLDEPAPNIIIDEEERLPTPTAELLQCHYDFGHLPFTKLQRMARDGTLPSRLSKCKVPVCSACQYGKATKRPWRSRNRRDREAERLPSKPGEVVSVDQMESPTPGLIAQMAGFLTKKRYKYTTVYVDQATGLGFVYLQKSSGAEETLEGKLAFERYAMARGVKIAAYHADNGIFKAKAWVDACNRQNQPLTFAGVGAHHTNGKAERRIRELQDMARTMLIHANRRWKNAITANLWPYAIRHANDCLNAAPNMQQPSKRSPLQLFSNTPVNVNRKHWKPFGCPVYVLDEALQGNKPYHKWKQRARVGIYLGQSPIHNRNVAMVLNRFTGHVSPQFHVKFDKSFDAPRQGFLESHWQYKTHFSATPERANVHRTPEPEGGQTPPKTGNKRARIQGPTETPASEPTQQQNDNAQPRNESPPTIPTEDGQDPSETTGTPNTTGEGSTSRQQKRRTTSERRGQREQGGSTPTEPSPSQKTRFGRTIRPVQRLIEIMTTKIVANTTHSEQAVDGELFCLETMFPHDPPASPNDSLLAYKAATSDPDTMYHHQAMKEPDAEQFMNGMQQEMDRQFTDGNFSIIHRSQIPKGEKIFPGVWQMRRKRDIKTREIKKHKARLNFDGSRMEKGIHYDQTYAPVASWASIRLILALVAANKWHTTQIDYVLAYPQAPVEREVYMEIPRGYELADGKNKQDYAFKLHANLYGQKQAGRVWYQYLSKRLVEDVGFTKSKIDECVFYKGSTVYVLYTDDSIIAGPDQEEIDQVIQEIQDAGLNITVEGDIKDFLGVNIEQQQDGTILFTQPHLIDKILSALRLDGKEAKPKDAPAASSRILKRHDDSSPFDNHFNYRSVIGMMNYLEAGSRSDISYATHQCARFCSNPRKEHGDAVKWLGRYLLGTRDKGMTFQPDQDAGLEVYVDADFAGNWDPKQPETDADTARSRHGYIIRYKGCPVVWKSQLQTEIALSSTESEYTGLSYALREAIPLMEILKELKGHGIDIADTRAKLHCKVFEDNSGALEMAKVHKFRPRTKHLNVKLHHFRGYVERGDITIHAIPTTEQLSDYLTKPLAQNVLAPLRKMVMGWTTTIVREREC